jgi:hypothetical protein
VTINATSRSLSIAPSVDGKLYSKYPDGDFPVVVASLAAAGWGQEITEGGTITGPAPLAVFVDAVGTAAGGVDDPFRELGYHWDFGYATPSTPGTWTHSSDPKGNQVGGPIAAHVYQTPGTYTLSLRAESSVAAGSIQAEASITVVVQNPDTVYATTNTICLHMGAGGSGGPTGCTYSNLSGGSWPTWAANKRYLLHEGADFSSLGAITINVSGVMIDTYGSGAKPIIGGSFSWATTAPTSAAFVVDKLTVVGLDFGSSAVRNVQGAYQSRSVLFHNCVGAIEFGSSKSTEAAYNAATMTRAYGLYADGFTLSECSSDFTGLSASSDYNLFPEFTQRLAVLGCTFDKDGTSGGGGHNFRGDTCYKIFTAHNSMRDPMGTTQHITLRGKGRLSWSSVLDDIATAGTLDGETRYAVIADNLLGYLDEPIVWSVALSPTTSSDNEAILDMIVERNTFYNKTGATPKDINFGGIRLTARDNTLVNGENRQTDATLAAGIGANADWTGPYYFQAKSLTLGDEYRADTGVLPDKAGT